MPIPETAPSGDNNDGEFSNPAFVAKGSKREKPGQVSALQAEIDEL